MIFSILSVNCSHLCIIYVKIFEKILSGGLEVSFSIVGISGTDKWFWKGRFSSRKKVHTQSLSVLQHFLHYPTVPMKVKSPVPVGEVNLDCLSRMAIELTSIELFCHKQLVNYAVAQAKNG